MNSIPLCVAGLANIDVRLRHSAVMHTQVWSFNGSVFLTHHLSFSGYLPSLNSGERCRQNSGPKLYRKTAGRL